jgi:hypothetical protein
VRLPLAYLRCLLVNLPTSIETFEIVIPGVVEGNLRGRPGQK